ncbi:hypothetical protein BLNAU_22475 [Blattamonas nauphoetae]|uniref:Uncharacterized protein n=1 Tax=Blattamonas nauphoetae TaxID=2049346 RepID=A0ABQ9WU29_9EUKA|nr:hypothetical protein BLNAU_22475 [Blattamonas nauphoetae]
MEKDSQLNPRFGSLRRHSRPRTADDNHATLPLNSSSRLPTLLPCCPVSRSCVRTVSHVVVSTMETSTPPHHVPIRRHRHQRDCLFQRPSQMRPHKRRRSSPSAFLSSAFTGLRRFCWQHKDTRQ